MVPAALGVLLVEPTGPLPDLLRILHLPTHLPKDFPQRLATAAPQVEVHGRAGSATGRA